jgi:hypothetical protein
MFIPLPKFMTVSFARAVFSGQKKLLHQSEVYSYKIPQYEEFSIGSAWDYFHADPYFAMYLPIGVNGVPKCDREYFWKVLGALRPAMVEGMIQQALEARGKQKAAAEEKLLI